VLSLLAWACWPWPSAYSFEVPREAKEWKRLYVGTVRQVWGLSTPAWLAAQIGQESGWRDGLTSSAGARGLCQFIPATAAGIEGQFDGLASLGRYSPKWCFYAQALHMRDLYADYARGRDRCEAIKFSGAAYNGGPTALAREIGLCGQDRSCDPTRWADVAQKTSRAGWAIRENRGYVTRITEREGAYASTGWGMEYCR
jgi:soluble lytic murein transglycosylase-like protein